MTLRGLVDREIGVYCRSCIETTIPGRFICRNVDEHRIEGQEFGMLVPPLACSYSKRDQHILAIADEDGGILILNTSQEICSERPQAHSDWRAHTNAVFDVDWVPGHNQLLTASGDQTVVLWDVEQEAKISTFRGHSSSVKTVRVQQENGAVFATGARDGHIMLWDSRLKQKDGSIPFVNCVRNAHKGPTTSIHSTKKRKPLSSQESQASVTAVVFRDEHALISAGTVDGSVKVWDLRKNYTVLKGEPCPQFTFPYAGNSVRKHGFSSLTLDATRSSLFASCMDNTIYQFDCVGLNKAPVAQFRGHQNSTFYIRTALSANGQFLLSGSADQHAYIWRVNAPRSPAWTLQGHSGEVSSVAWCPADIGTIVTLGDDAVLKLWRLGPAEGLLPLQYWACQEKGPLTGQARRASITEEVAPAPKRTAPATPKKGTTVPPSPVKLSSALRQFLVSVSGTHRPPQTQAGFAKPVTVSQWLSRKDPHRTKAGEGHTVAGKTTPKKLNIKSMGSIGSAKSPLPATDGVCSRVGDARAVSSCKRKLYGQNSPQSSSPEAKRARAGSDENCPRSLSKVPKTGQLSPSSNGVLKEMENIVSQCATTDNAADNTSVKHAKKKLFGGCKSGEMTPPKCSGLVTCKQYSSPTINLPNYVEDPQPRTPVAPIPDNNNEPRTPNWLNKIRLERQNSGTKSLPLTSNVDLEEESTLKLEPSSEVQAKAPTANKNTPERKGIQKRRGSILQYFSPKSAKDSKA